MELSSVCSRNASSTVTTCSCCTLFIVAIAAPSFSTSRGPRKRITSAASVFADGEHQDRRLLDAVIIHLRPPMLYNVGDDPRIFWASFFAMFRFSR